MRRGMSHATEWTTPPPHARNPRHRPCCPVAARPRLLLHHGRLHPPAARPRPDHDPDSRHSREPTARLSHCHYTMNKALSIAILAAGIVLLVFGINAHDSLASNAKEALTGSPTDKSMWLIVLGLIGIIVGGLNSF